MSLLFDAEKLVAKTYLQVLTCQLSLPHALPLHDSHGILGHRVVVQNKVLEAPLQGRPHEPGGKLRQLHDAFGAVVDGPHGLPRWLGAEV